MFFQTGNSRFIAVRGRPPAHRPLVIMPGNAAAYSKNNQYIDLTKEEHKIVTVGMRYFYHFLLNMLFLRLVSVLKFDL